MTDFPPLLRPYKSMFNGSNVVLHDRNEILSKLDQILNAISNINNAVGNLTKRTAKIEEGLDVLRKSDKKTDNEIKALKLSNSRHDGELAQQEKIIGKMVLPALDDMITFLQEFNVKGGRVVNVDFKSRSNLWKNELKAYYDNRLKL